MQVSQTSKAARTMYTFLKMHPVGVLSTVEPGGNPHAAVIYFSVNEAFDFTFVTKRDTQKHTNITHKREVSLTCYEAGTQSSIQIIGTAEDISDTPGADQAFQETLQTSRQTSTADVPPISKLHAGTYVAYRLRPQQIRMAVFGRTDPYRVLEFPAK